MYTVEYFEKLLKKKRQFTKEDIARMRPSFIRSYMITGHINRLYLERNIKKINGIPVDGLSSAGASLWM